MEGSSSLIIPVIETFGERPQKIPVNKYIWKDMSKRQQNKRQQNNWKHRNWKGGGGADSRRIHRPQFEAERVKIANLTPKMTRF